MAVLPAVSPNTIPFLNTKYLSIQDLAITNNVLTPTTKINVGTGVCRDSNSVYDMYLTVPVIIDATTIGLNGIDSGVLLANRVYYVLLVSDPVSGQPSGAMVSLSATAPVMPFGYSAFRVIGFMATNVSVNFIKCYVSGSQNARMLTYDAPQATSVIAGISATYAPIVLTSLVPSNADNIPVLFRADWLANAGGDRLDMNGGNAIGNEFSAIAVAAGTFARTMVFGQVLSQLVAGVPTSQYKVSAIGGVAITVVGFQYFL